MQEIVDLLTECLGPIAPLSNEQENELIRRMIGVEYPNGRNIKEAIRDLDISDRQRRPYQDALILGRLKGLGGEALREHIKNNTVIYRGAKIISVISTGR